MPTFCLKDDNHLSEAVFMYDVYCIFAPYLKNVRAKHQF